MKKTETDSCLRKGPVPSRKIEQLAQNGAARYIVAAHHVPDRTPAQIPEALFKSNGE